MPPLRGRDAICKYLKDENSRPIAWSVLSEWIEKHNFPAVKKSKYWLSHTDSIDQWIVDQIRYGKEG